jgi:hypothetical protein
VTVFLRDMSDFDSNEDVTGFVGVTHKATEGTTVVHKELAPRLNKYRAQEVPILGAYHVVRTPGIGRNGSLGAQLSYWFSYLDSQIPWWRTYPHFILQVDLEKWPYDSVSATTGIQFAKLLADSGAPGWKITYASRGQYGNSLNGIATPLWNAAYHSGAYPGDNATDWRPYSGKTPTFWQYTDKPFDKNAFRGTLDELLALIRGGGNDVMQWNNPDTAKLVGGRDPDILVVDMWCAIMNLTSAYAKGVPMPFNVRLDAIAAALGKPVQVTLDDATRQALVASVTTALQNLNVGLTPDAIAKVEAAVHADLAKIQITVGA